MREFPRGGLIGKTVHLWRRLQGFHIPLYAANASFFIVMAVFPALLLLLGLLRYTTLDMSSLMSSHDTLLVKENKFAKWFGKETYKSWLCSKKLKSWV